MSTRVPAEDLERLDRYIAEGRLIRHAWTGQDAEGRETACLLAALVPECSTAEDVEACPVAVMPRWLAHLTVWIDDAGTAEAWPGYIRRYAALAWRWHVLTPEHWHGLDYECRALAVREAASHTIGADVLAACQRVAALCDREAGGEVVGVAEWDAAEAAAEETAAEAQAAELAAATEAEAAAWSVATMVAAWVAEAARSAAVAAVAAWAMMDVVLAGAATWAALEAVAAAAAADRIIVGVLDAIERAVKAFEAWKRDKMEGLVFEGFANLIDTGGEHGKTK